MRMYDIIDKKKNCGELTEEEISFFINGYVKDEIPDYQVSALLMAIRLNGMTDYETSCLTIAMAKSGDVCDLSDIPFVCCDKHSSGGVGDKTSLIVSPMVAALNIGIAKMSGRGLGFTGGTIDKLESIPHFKTEMSNSDFIRQVNIHKIAIISQTKNIAPADKKLYALRDVSATVDSIPLIASSIMSKKLAAGDKNILLDVKCGSGAFMKTFENAKALAETMVSIGKRNGRNICALITNMNEPLGNAIGNNLEIIEAVEILKGNKKGKLYELCVELCAEMQILCLGIEKNTAIVNSKQIIESGRAFKKFKEFVLAQGGDLSFIENIDKFEKAKFKIEIYAKEKGFIADFDTEKIGVCSMLLGAGRNSLSDKIDMGAGIVLNKKLGDSVEKDEKIATLYTSFSQKVEMAVELFNTAYIISEYQPEDEDIVLNIIK